MKNKKPRFTCSHCGSKNRFEKIQVPHSRKYYALNKKKDTEGEDQDYTPKEHQPRDYYLDITFKYFIECKSCNFRILASENNATLKELES
jgi:DNA-directed RNA polymerase subunit RPC12/RpoP